MERDKIEHSTAKLFALVKHIKDYSTRHLESKFLEEKVLHAEAVVQDLAEQLGIAADIAKRESYRQQETGTCCLCGGEYYLGGCNPDPLSTNPHARCCHICDVDKVQPARSGT